MGRPASDDSGEQTGRRVLVAGASGGTGRAILGVLRNGEDTVRATTRSEEKVESLEELGADEVAVCDLLEPGDPRTAVEGCDAVVCTVGTTPGPGILFGDLVDGAGVEALVDAAVEADVDRFVLVSSIGVGDSKPGMPLPLRALLGVTGILGAKAAAEDHLRGSGLGYTVLRPGGLTDDDPTGDVLVAEGGDTVSGSIPRADLARVAVGALDAPEAEGRTFEVVSRDGSRSNPTGLVDAEWVHTDATAPADRHSHGSGEGD